MANGFNLRVIPGQWNDISENLKNTVKPLKRGEIRTYRLPVPVEQDVIVDNHGTKFLKNSKTKGYTWPASELIPTMDEIQDEDGNTKKIAVIRSYDSKSGDVIPHPLIIGEHMDGYIIIHGGQQNMERYYAYLELTDYNGSKPNRDVSKPIKFYTIDPEADSIKEGKKLDILTEELVYVKDASKADLIIFGKALLWDTDGISEQHLRNNLKSFVHKNPGKLSDMHKNKPKIENLALIKSAMEQQIISFNEPENKFTFTSTGQDIATFSRIDGKKTIDQFADWLATHKNGNGVKAAIKNFAKQVHLQD